MSRMLSLSVLILISISIIGCGKSKDGDKPLEKKIIGKWQVDVERSLELYKTSKHYKTAHVSKQQQARTKIEKTAALIQLKITGSEFQINTPNDSNVVKYTVISRDDEAQTVSTKIEGREDEIFLYTIIEGTYINFVSRATDEFDYFVWKPIK